MRRSAALTAVLAVMSAFALPQALTSSSKAARVTTGVMWKDPGNIRSLNLFYGPGGKRHQPRAPVEFVKEDLKGTSPKFDVRDADGEKWRAKLGPEARPETVAARLLWAVGYPANENYFFSDLKVENLPAQLARGQSFVAPPDDVKGVRLQRHPGGGKKNGVWKWRHNPFTGTREFNGLRVMMALINNWDLKDENNAIYNDPSSPSRELYEVTDVGASFGKTGRSYSEVASKGNLRSYTHSKFISKIAPDYVDFNFPTHPPLIDVLIEPSFFWHQMRQRWIGRHIPRADARWIASLLAQLSPEQIRDAFRAANYPPDQIESYAATLESRIAQLNKL
ncbi:MAG TPA: hypothetical protein VKE71_15980 [Candidatus Angelobacter sp.]|nr:hypothetical protein [Candidatus Angelobacter sp.]